MYYRNLVNICVQGSSANWKIRVVGNMQGKLNVCVCVWFQNRNTPIQISFRLLRFFSVALSGGYNFTFIPFKIYSWLFACSSVVSLILLYSSHHPNLSHAENRKLSKQTRNNNSNSRSRDDGDDDEKERRKSECINIRMCDFITQPSHWVCVLFNVQHVVIHPWLGKVVYSFFIVVPVAVAVVVEFVVIANVETIIQWLSLGKCKWWNNTKINISDNGEAKKNCTSNIHTQTFSGLSFGEWSLIKNGKKERKREREERRWVLSACVLPCFIFRLYFSGDDVITFKSLSPHIDTLLFRSFHFTSSTCVRVHVLQQFFHMHV